MISTKNNRQKPENMFTEDEFYMYDDISDILKKSFENAYPSIHGFIPTVADLEAINIESHVREYMPFIIYLIKHLGDVKKAGDERYTDEQLKTAAETRAYLDNLQFNHMIEDPTDNPIS